MSLISYYLAIGSNDLKVYDLEDKDINKYKLKSTCHNSTNNSSVSCLSWNHTNQVVAVCGNKGSVSLYQANNGHELAVIPFPEIKDPFYEKNIIKCVSFSSNSRYLACGIASAVHIWDLKKRILKFTSTNKVIKGQVNCISFLNENYLISGDSTGYIRLWDTKNSSAESPKFELAHESNASLTCMESPFSSQTKLASGYNDGSLYLWNTTTSTNLRNQKIHNDSLTSISCSTRNIRLISTVGLDGKLTLVDINEKPIGNKTSALIETNEPLHSVSFHENAINCAVGSSSGKVYIYDWRNVKSPVVTIESTNESNSDDSVPAYVVKFQTAAVQKSTFNSPQSAEKLTNVKSDDVNKLNNERKSMPDPLNLKVDDNIQLKSINESRPLIKTESNSSIKSIDIPQSNRASLLKLPSPSRSSSTKRTSQFLETLITTDNSSSSSSANVINTSFTDIPSNVNINQTNTSSYLESQLNESVSNNSNNNTSIISDVDVENVRRSLRPITIQDLDDSLQLLRFDIHKELQVIIKEQAKQFEIAKEETNEIISKLSQQLQELLQANKELRLENEKLRKIY